MDAMAASDCSNSLNDLASVREMLEFLAQNHLETVRIEVSEDDDDDDDGEEEGDYEQGDSSGDDAGADEDDVVATLSPAAGRPAKRKKLVLRRRKARTASGGAPSGGDTTSSPVSMGSLNDLTHVTEMLDFLVQNSLEAVRIELSEDEGDAVDDGGRDNPSTVDGLNDLENVREMLEFLAQNQLERVRIEIAEGGGETGDDAGDSRKRRRVEPRRRTSSVAGSGSPTTSRRKQASKQKNKKRSEELLSKNRVTAKQTYYKTICTLKDLQDEVTRLEKASKELIAKHREQLPAANANLLAAAHRIGADPGSGTEVPPRAVAQTRYQVLHERYMKSILEQDSLERENGFLRDKQEKCAKVHKALQQLVSAEIRGNERAHKEWLERSERPRGEKEIHQVTSAYCAEITSRAYERVVEFRKRNATYFSSGADLFGWKDFHTTEKNCLKYSLEKIFLYQSADDVASRCWSLATTEGAAKQLYSPSLNVRFHFLQRVDENNIVCYRTIDRPAGENGLEKRMKTVVLISRVYLGDGKGWIIMFCALDPARILVSVSDPPKGRSKLVPMREEMWIDNFKWVICEPMGEHGQHCKHIFGGVLDGMASANASQWILEELMVGIRTERGGMGPFDIVCDNSGSVA